MKGCKMTGIGKMQKSNSKKGMAKNEGIKPGFKKGGKVKYSSGGASGGGAMTGRQNKSGW